MSRDRGTPVVVVAHRIPAAITPLAEWFDEIASRIVLVTTQECEPGYRGAFAEIIVVQDYSNSDEVAYQVERLCRERRVERIVCGTEDDIVRLADIRDRYGIPGMGRADAGVFTDKLLMKLAVRDRVRTPDFEADVTEPALSRFLDRTGWPVVIKPRRNYGSRGVQVVASVDRLLAEAATRPTDDTIVEEFVPAVMHHIDGFIRDGRVLVSCPSRYVNDCLSFQDSTPLGSVQLDHDDPVRRELDEFARDVAATMPRTELTPFHLEAFRSGDSGKITFCEIACRLGGGHILEAMTYRLGLNPVSLWYRSQAGLPVDTARLALRGGCFGFLLVPPRRGNLLALSRPELPSYVTDFFVETPVPHTFDGASASTDSMLAFVVTAPDASSVEARLRACMSIADHITTWETE
jgi:hypothetical protein